MSPISLAVKTPRFENEPNSFPRKLLELVSSMLLFFLVNKTIQCFCFYEEEILFPINTLYPHIVSFFVTSEIEMFNFFVPLLNDRPQTILQIILNVQTKEKNSMYVPAITKTGPIHFHKTHNAEVAHGLHLYGKIDMAWQNYDAGWPSFRK